MRLLKILSVCIILILSGNAFALEAVINNNYSSHISYIKSKISYLKKAVTIMDSNFTQEISDINSSLSETNEEINAVQTCNDIQKIYAPEDENADEKGCISIQTSTQIKTVYAGNATIPTTGEKEVSLGHHDFCALNVISGPGGLDTYCWLNPVNYDTNAKQVWTIKIGDLSSTKTHTCGAVCFDISN